MYDHFFDLRLTKNNGFLTYVDPRNLPHLLYDQTWLAHCLSIRKGLRGQGSYIIKCYPNLRIYYYFLSKFVNYIMSLDLVCDPLVSRRFFYLNNIQTVVYV